MSFEVNKKWFIPALILISCFALLLRLEVCRELKNNDSQVERPSVYTDMYTYKLYSEQIVKGEYKQDFYYQPFYYAVFLPVIKQFFGFGIWPVIIVQILFSVLTIWFAALASSMLWGRKAGIVTALLLAFSTIMILYVPYHLIATLQAFWVSLIAFLTLKCLDYDLRCRPCETSRSTLNWGVLGFVVSLGILTRGNIWFFVPGIIAAAVIFRFKGNKQENLSWFRKILPVLVLLLMIIIPQLPFAWKNTQITGKITGPSTAAGSVLCLGNTPESPPGGRDAGMGPGPMEYPETCRFWSANAEKVSVFRRMWEWFCREPLAFTELQWRKMLLFWDRREIPNNIAIEYQGMKSQTLQISGLIPGDEVETPRGRMSFISMNIIPASIILLVLSLAGIFLLVSRMLKVPKTNRESSYLSSVLKRIVSHPGEYLMLYFVIAYWLGTAAFYILARFRVPILPLLAIFAGGYLQSCFYSWKYKKPVAGKFVVLLAALILVNFGYDLYRYSLEASIIRIVRPDGVMSPLADELLVMDNGPYSFGSWRPIEIKQGVPIEKTFSLPVDIKPDAKIIFRIDIIWEIPGKFVFDINGKNYLLRESKPIKKTYEFPINPDASGKITLIPKNMDCKIFTIVDFQRDYARTRIGGKDPGGELVSQLILKKK